VPLRREAKEILCAAFEQLLISTATTRRKTAFVDLNRLLLTGGGSLLARLDWGPDPRKARGIRHRLATVLLVAGVALLPGANSFTAIREWADEASQEVLRGWGTRRSPSTGRHVAAPHEPTLRRALQAADVVALDCAVGGWLEEVRQGGIERGYLAVAVEGKSVLVLQRWLRDHPTQPAL